MLARIRKSMEEKDEGFTLIELLVVIIIIGILAAIAIPVFLNQRKKAVDSSMKSDLRTVANEMETFFVDNQAYPATAAITQTGGAGTAVTVGAGGGVVQTSKGNTIAVTVPTTGTNVGAYCVVATNSSGTQNWVYKSNAGGLQAKTVLDCAGF